MMGQLTLNGETRVTGLIGDPVAHTRSPAILNAAFAEAGLNWVYLAFPVPKGKVRLRMSMGTSFARPDIVELSFRP